MKMLPFKQFYMLLYNICTFKFAFCLVENDDNNNKANVGVNYLTMLVGQTTSKFFLYFSA